MGQQGFLEYAAIVNPGITSWASLASDTNLLAGAACAKWDNSSNLYPEICISGGIKVATSGTLTSGGVIEVWAVGSKDYTPNWPDNFGGTDATVTISSSYKKSALLKPVCSFIISSTNSVVYEWNEIPLTEVFRTSKIPKYGQIWIVHSTGQNLASSGSYLNLLGGYPQIGA